MQVRCASLGPGGYVPVTRHHKFQQSVQMTVVVPRLQFIDRVGHCSYDTVTGILSRKLCRRPLRFFCAVLCQGCCVPVAVQRQVPGLDSAVPWRCRYCSSSTVVDIPVVVVQTAQQIVEVRVHSTRAGSASQS